MTHLTDDAEHNFQLFFEDALATGCIWGLQSPDGWALCASERYQNSEVMPFWSQPEYAQIHCVDDWQHYEVVPVSLEEWLDEWLPGMHDDVILVGVNWNEALEGLEVEPLDILQEFE